MQFFRVSCLLVFCWLLVACAQSSFPLADSISGLRRAGVLGSAGDTIPAMPDLRYEYLRIQVKGNTAAMLVLGFLDPHPNGPVEVWYSGTREALRIQNGRVVGMTGATHDWAGVRMEPMPPAWESIRSDYKYTRYRDQMPGYAFGITERVTLSPLNAPPSIDLLASLTKDKAQTYQWYREQSAPQPLQSSQDALPDAWFAWGKHRGAFTVVYSEQCLAPGFCLRMQRWPVLEEQP